MISNPYTIYYVLHTSVIYTITPQYTNILSFRCYTYLKKNYFVNKTESGLSAYR